MDEVLQYGTPTVSQKNKFFLEKGVMQRSAHCNIRHQEWINWPTASGSTASPTTGCKPPTHNDINIRIMVRIYYISIYYRKEFKQKLGLKMVFNEKPHAALMQFAWCSPGAGGSQVK